MSNLVHSHTEKQLLHSQFIKIGTIAFFSRLVLNTAKRFPYPFAPALSRGLRVHLTSITSLIALNQAAAILGLIIAPMGDRLGYKRMMLAGMAMLIIGMLVTGCLPIYGIVLFAFFLTGLAKNTFDPAIQAYVGERTPYSRRGLAIGILELSWAGSTLIGIPFIGFLINDFGWKSPFFFISGTGVICFVFLMLVIQRDSKRTHKAFSSLFFLKALKQLIRQSQSLAQSLCHYIATQ